LAIALGVETSFSAPAGDFPNRPIEMVFAYPPGGGTDSSFLPFKDMAGKAIGQTIVNVYKPGAAGGVGAAYAANAKPDGYTLTVASPSNFIVLPLTKDMGYTLDSFTPVCNFSETRNYFLVREDSPYKTIADFFEAAKKKKMTYASPGANTTSHIIMEALSRQLGIQLIHVPYSGGSTAFTAVLGGHADIGIAGGSLGMAAPGKLRAIAVSGDKRFAISPDVPTLNEFGYFSAGAIYNGVWAPKGTPEPIINKLYQAFKRASEENRDQSAKILLGAEQAPYFLGPAETEKLFQADNIFYKKILGDMGLLHRK
jgi:tripartite-type tricarboxylate transporter receptor subunit TctC